MRLLLVYVVLAMAGVQRAADALDEDDRKRPPPAVPQTTVQRARLLGKKFIVFGASMGSAIAVALVARHLPLLSLPATWLQCASAFFAAWAGLARLGWSGQTYKGVTAVERADALIFHVLCWLALNLAVAGNL